MDKLKPCPFCGSEAAEPVFIGNDHTKKRTVTIKCKAPGCTKGVTVGALRFSHKWCHEEAVKKWNTRATDTALAAAEARIAELEKALEPFADWYVQPPGKFDPVTADHCATGIIARVGDLRRAAALLKEKE